MTARPHDLHDDPEGSPLDELGAALRRLNTELALLRQARKQREAREGR